jgi:hypothetical protein
MAYFPDAAMDAALAQIRDNTTHLYILSGAPASWTPWAQVTALMIGYKAAPTIAAPSDGAVSGRRIVVSAITDGVVNPGGGSTSGELWALVDATNFVVRASGDVTNDQVLVNGNTFTSTSFSITIPDAA